MMFEIAETMNSRSSGRCAARSETAGIVHKWSLVPKVDAAQFKCVRVYRADFPPVVPTASILAIPGVFPFVDVIKITAYRGSIDARNCVPSLC